MEPAQLSDGLHLPLSFPASFISLPHIIPIAPAGHLVKHDDSVRGDQYKIKHLACFLKLCTSFGLREQVGGVTRIAVCNHLGSTPELQALNGAAGAVQCDGHIAILFEVGEFSCEALGVYDDAQIIRLIPHWRGPRFISHAGAQHAVAVLLEIVIYLVSDISHKYAPSSKK